MTAELAAQLRALADDADALETARLAIENTLVEWRDSRLSYLGRNNGLVIKERDGTSSDIIRLGPEDGVRIALKALADRAEAES